MQAAIEMNVIYAFLIIAHNRNSFLYLTRYIRNKVSNRITLDMMKRLNFTDIKDAYEFLMIKMWHVFK